MPFMDWQNVLFNKAIEFLARRSHSEAELKLKLWQVVSKKAQYNNTSSFPPLFCDEMHQHIETVLERCRKNQWLDEKKFAQSYYNMRQRRGYGHRRILLELKSKGISLDLIENFISPSEESEENIRLLADQIRRKYGTIDVNNLKQKQRIYRFLLNRGFSLEIANSVYSLIKN